MWKSLFQCKSAKEFGQTLLHTQAYGTSPIFLRTFCTKSDAFAQCTTVRRNFTEKVFWASNVFVSATLAVSVNAVFMKISHWLLACQRMSNSLRKNWIGGHLRNAGVCSFVYVESILCVLSCPLYYFPKNPRKGAGKYDKYTMNCTCTLNSPKVPHLQLATLSRPWERYRWVVLMYPLISCTGKNYRNTRHSYRWFKYLLVSTFECCKSVRDICRLKRSGEITVIWSSTQRFLVDFDVGVDEIVGFEPVAASKTLTVRTLKSV